MAEKTGGESFDPTTYRRAMHVIVAVPSMGGSNHDYVVVSDSGNASSPDREGTEAALMRAAPALLRDGVDRTEIPTKRSGSLVIDSGLHVLLGRTGMGKTTLIRALAAPGEVGEAEFVRVNVLEPLDDLSDLLTEPPALSFRSGLVAAGRVMLKGGVPLIDSGRALVYAGGGATGARGVNMSLFQYLTVLNNLLTLQGLRAMIALNPLVEAEQYDSFLTYVQSSVRSVVEVTNVSFRGSVPDRIAFRQASRPERTWRNLEFTGSAAAAGALDSTARIAGQTDTRPVTNLQVTLLNSLRTGK